MKKITLFVTLLFAVTQLFAQNITGKVTDQSGEALIGATIVEKGTNNGTTTNTEGKFQIKVSDLSAIFQISYIGYKSKEVKGSDLSTTIVLEEGNLLD